MNLEHTPLRSHGANRRAFMARMLASTALGAMGSPVLLRQFMAHAADALSPQDRAVFRAKFENYLAAKAWGAAVADNPAKSAPALKAAYASSYPGSPEDVAFARAIAAAENVSSRYGALDSDELIVDVKEKLALAGLVARAAPGWGKGVSALLGSLSGASPSIIKLLKRADEKWHAPHERVFTESLRGSGERIYADELRLARLQQQHGTTGQPLEARSIPAEVRNALPLGLGQQIPHPSTVVKLPQTAQQLYTAADQGRVKNLDDAQKAASHVGEQAVSRVASTRAPVRAGETKAYPQPTPGGQDMTRVAQQDAQQQFYYNMAEINGAAEVGAAMIQMMGGSSQDAQKFAGAITRVGSAALTISAYMAGTLPGGPLVVVGAVAGAVVAVINFFKEDQSSEFFLQLAEAIRSIGEQLEVVYKNQLLIMEELQQIRQDLTAFRFENRDLVQRLSDKVTQFQQFTQAVYQSQSFQRFNESTRSFDDDLANGLQKESALHRLKLCRDFVIGDAYAPQFTWGNPGEQKSWSSKASIGNMVVMYANTIRTFGGTVPPVNTTAAGRQSEFPCPAIWRLGAAHFMAAALQADAAKALLLDSQEVLSLATKYLLAIYYDGCALRQTCIALSSPDLVRKALDGMRGLLGITNSSAPLTGVLKVLKRVADNQDEKRYTGYTLVEENNIWSSVLNHQKWPRAAHANYYEVDGRLFELTKGADPLDEAKNRGLLKPKLGKESEPKRATDIILNTPIDEVVSVRWSIGSVAAQRERQTCEYYDTSDNLVATCYKDKMKWTFTVSQPAAGKRDFAPIVVKGECEVVGILQAKIGSRSTITRALSAKTTKPSEKISTLPKLFEFCAALLAEDDRNRAASVQLGVPKAFLDEMRKIEEGKYMAKLEEHGRMLNLMTAMANWRSVPDLADDFPIWAASHNVLSTAEQFEAFIKNWYLRQEPREKYAEDLVQALRELYEADFKGIQDTVAAVDPLSSIAIVDHILAALDTFLAACGVPHEPFVTA